MEEIFIAAWVIEGIYKFIVIILIRNKRDISWSGKGNVQEFSWQFAMRSLTLSPIVYKGGGPRRG